MEKIYIDPNDIEILNSDAVTHEMEYDDKSFPKVITPLLKNAKELVREIENMLYKAPAIINLIQATKSQTLMNAVLTDEQKRKIASGTLKVMKKKDGSLIANLVDPKTNKIVGTIPLKEVKISPDFAKAMSDYSNQIQMAQIGKEVQKVQLAVEEVRGGQEYDRLATAYSCQQKLLQAMGLKNKEIKVAALLRIAGDAEDSRNQLMLSQKSNVEIVMNEPEALLTKIIKGSDKKNIDTRMEEIRENFSVSNMVSLVEALAYQELGEVDAAKMSLAYHEEFIQKTYIDEPGLIQRLDMMDPLPDGYWSTTIVELDNKIKCLISTGVNNLIESEIVQGEYYGN